VFPDELTYVPFGQLVCGGAVMRAVGGGAVAGGAVRGTVVVGGRVVATVVGGNVAVVTTGAEVVVAATVVVAADVERSATAPVAVLAVEPHDASATAPNARTRDISRFPTATPTVDPPFQNGSLDGARRTLPRSVFAT